MRKPTPFGKYLLLDRVAVGGMAEVFAAKTFGVEGFERLVAIKRILPTMVEDDEFITMFIDEARIAALLQHANVVQIYELGKHDDSFYIAMEYVSGRDVRLLVDKFKKKGQTVPIPMAVFIMAKMCEGLDYAHRKKDTNGKDLGLIHRDISPQNVLVSYEGEVKIIDFGIAKAAGRLQKTQAGILKGKFGYMSPEQVRGLNIDHRSDLFSAGVMFYEMLTGAKLFSGESDFSTLEKVRAGEVVPPTQLNPDIPPALEKVVLKALAKERDERYQWGSELHDDLLRFLYSGSEVYSTKSLSHFMKEAFAEEFKKETERNRRWWATAPEETADFESAGTLPPQPVPAAALAAARAAQQKGKDFGDSTISERVKIGGPNDFMTSELRLQERTTSHLPFDPLAAGDRSELKTEAASLAELGMLEAQPTQVKSAQEIEQERAAQVVVKQKRAQTPGRGSRPVEELKTEQRPTRADRDESTLPGQGKGGAFHDVDTIVPGEVRAPAMPSRPKLKPVAPAPPPPAKGKGPRVAIAALAGFIVLLGGVYAVRNVLGGRTGGVVVSVTPAKSAHVTIDGQPQGLVQGMAPLSARLPLGVHQLEVTADGFEPFEQAITVTKKPLAIDVALKPVAQPEPAEEPAEQPEERQPVAEQQPEEKQPKAVQKLAASEPAKAEPKQKEPPPLKESRRADAEPPKPVAQPKPVERAPERVVERVVERPAAAELGPSGSHGALMIVSDPKGAMVAINGSVVGKSPVLADNLPADKPATVKLVLAGYKPLTVTQAVKPGGRDLVKLQMEALSDGGTTTTAAAAPAQDKPAEAAAAVGGKAKVIAMCLPPAKVIIDGKDTGRWTPVGAGNAIEVSAGKHAVVCETATGARSTPEERVVGAGETFMYKAKIQ